MKKLFYIALAALMMLPAASCKKTPQPTNEVLYILDLSCDASYSLALSSTNGFLPVQVTPQGASLTKLGRVSCSPDDVIECVLSEQGIGITPKKIGATTLTVWFSGDENVKATCEVTVSKDPILPASVSITKTDSHFSGGILNLAAGESLQLEAKVKNVNDELTTDYPVVWSVTEGEDVISITEGGKVTAKSGASGDSGKVKVEVQGYPIADVLTVKVLQAPTGMGGFTFTGNYSQNGNGEVIMKKGKTCPFMFSFTPSTAIQVPDVIVSDESILSASVSGKTITLTGVKSSTSPVTVTVRSHYNSSVSKTLTVYVFDYDKFDVKPGDYVYWNGSQFLSKDCGLRQVSSTNIYADASGNRKSSPTFTGTTQSGGYNYIGVIASTSIPNEEDFMGCGYLSQCRDKTKASELYSSYVRSFRKSNLMGLSNSPSTHALVIKKDQSTDKMHWQDNIEEIASSEDQQSGTNIYQYQLFGILAFSQEQAAELNPRFPKYNYTYCLSGVVAHLLQVFYSDHVNNSSYAVRPVKYIDSNYTDVPKLYGASSSRTTTGWFLPGDLEWSGIQWNLPLIKASLDNGYSTALSGEYWSTCEAQYGRTTVFQFTVSGSPVIARTDVYKERDNYKSYARAVLYL